MCLLIEALGHSSEVTKSLLSWGLYFNAVMKQNACDVLLHLSEVVVPCRKLKRVQDVESPQSSVLLW